MHIDLNNMNIFHKRNTIIYFIFCFVIALNSQCRKSELLTGSNVELTFSSDTILFDTLFTTIGSTTKYFKVYNSNNGKINITSIQLAQGTNSPYRINVNGEAGVSFENIEIEENDSIFIFVEVTIDPNNTNNPLIVEDSILFLTNNNLQKVVLNAWGQDAYFHVNEIITQDETWNNDKPHVIYNYCAVDSANTLIIPAGTTVHGHANATLLVYKSSLLVNGTLGSPVIFKQDRMEDYLLYDADSTAGQWRGIYFFEPLNSKIENAEIINATIGIQIDTATLNNKVKLANVKVQNSLFAGILTQGANVAAVNCLFGNAGQYSAYISIGGDVKFQHCTFGNYWQGQRNSPLFVFKDFYESNAGLQYRPFINAEFYNCIMYGNNENEFVMDTLGRDLSGEVPIVHFTNNLIKSEDSIDHPDFFTSCFLNNNPEFTNAPQWNFKIPTNSFSVDKGYLSNIIVDIDGNTRFNGNDLGCYEAY